MNLANNTIDEYFWVRYEKFADTRTKGWPLVDSPVDVILLVAVYFAMVRWGPRIMEKRKPFKLQGLLVIYNFFLVLLNAHIAKDLFLGSYRRGYGLLCQRGQPDFHVEEMRIVRAIWLFYVSKVIEFADTLFFILRKKKDQLSVLHIYHHSTVLPFSWSSVKWYPSGAAIRLPMINSIIHVIMYLYYGLSALGPGVQKYLWWKKYLTVLQLVQFVVNMTWAMNSLKQACNHHIWVDLANIGYMCTLLYLFGSFYLKKYTKKNK